MTISLLKDAEAHARLLQRIESKEGAAGLCHAEHSAIVRRPQVVRVRCRDALCRDPGRLAEVVACRGNDFHLDCVTTDVCRASGVIPVHDAPRALRRARRDVRGASIQSVENAIRIRISILADAELARLVGEVVGPGAEAQGLAVRGGIEVLRRSDGLGRDALARDPRVSGEVVARPAEDLHLGRVAAAVEVGAHVMVHSEACPA
mmetsp:Transcript_16165/g.42791  ORF Transcript_16165/g.42791 Transcript_16165/m.42791 type:complete len:205 (-) Transcript_16165:382-996(-)